MGVVVLLAAKAISFDVVLAGIAGDTHIKPYSILIVFMSLAYISVAVDQIGLTIAAYTVFVFECLLCVCDTEGLKEDAVDLDYTESGTESGFMSCFVIDILHM